MKKSRAFVGCKVSPLLRGESLGLGRPGSLLVGPGQGDIFSHFCLLCKKCCLCFYEVTGLVLSVVGSGGFPKGRRRL